MWKDRGGSIVFILFNLGLGGCLVMRNFNKKEKRRKEGRRGRRGLEGWRGEKLWEREGGRGR